MPAPHRVAYDRYRYNLPYSPAALHWLPPHYAANSIAHPRLRTGLTYTPHARVLRTTGYGPRAVYLPYVPLTPYSAYVSHTDSLQTDCTNGFRLRFAGSRWDIHRFTRSQL